MARLIVVIFGLMGVGKTTLARALGEALGWPVVMSDVVRKALAGLAPTTATREEFGKGIYSREFSARTYAEMRRQALEHLKAGAAGVILDASFKCAPEREAIRQLGREAGAHVVFVQCECPLNLVRERLKQREANAAAISDGRLEILDMQVEDFDQPGEADRPLFRLDTRMNINIVLNKVLEFISERNKNENF